MPTMLELYLVTSPGLEAVLAAELGALGLRPNATEPGGVSLAGDLDTVARLDLELRTAHRILVRVAQFEARHFSTLERSARPLGWERFVTPGTRVHFRVTSKKSKLFHEDAIAERLEGAVAASVKGVTALRSAAELDTVEMDVTALAPTQRFVVRVFRDKVTISADASGPRLHRRGYRQATAKAPLRETIAAAMLLASGWDGDRPLIDPFTGSGTIPIEAALLARRIAPGLARRFAAERWPSMPAAIWETARSEAKARVRPTVPVPIVGGDRDAGAIAAAEANAERAGVAGDVTFLEQSVSALAAGAPDAAVVTNPPYGDRVGDRGALRDLYARLGTVARERLPEGTVTLLVAHPEHRRALGLDLAPAFQTENGGIPVVCLSGPVAGPA
jgi:putative N6-adenine-specific DNA methylase